MSNTQKLTRLDLMKAVRVAGSQSALARLLGVTRAAVSVWVAGSSQPRRETAEKIRQVITSMELPPQDP